MIPPSYVQEVNQCCEDYTLTLDDVSEYLTIDQQTAKELDSCNFDTRLSEESNEHIAESVWVNQEDLPWGLDENFIE